MATDNQQNPEELLNQFRQLKALFDQEKERINNSKELNNAFKSIEASLLRQFGIQENINTNLKSTRDLNKEIQKNRNKISEISLKENELSTKASSLLSDQIKNQKILLSDKIKESENLNKQVQNLKIQEDLLKSIGKWDTDGVEIQELKIKLSKDLIKSIQEEEQIQNEINSLKKNDLYDDATKLAYYQEIRSSLEKGNNALKDNLKTSEKLDRNIFSIANNIVSAFPKMGVITEAFNHAAVASRELGGGIEGTAAGFNKIISSTLAFDVLLAAVVEEAFKIDNQVTNIAKSLGISKDQAHEIRSEFAAYAALSGETFLNTNRLLEAQSSLTKELGIAGQYTGQQLEDYVRLTKLIGLNETQAASISRLGLLNRISTEETTKAILRGATFSERQNKISLDNKQILSDISNLSEGILIKFRQNPEELGKAIAQAKALGLSLEKIDSIGDSLLDFEGSLERTLKAELLTGRDINVERARSAALLGDQQTLMSEISKQVGSLDDFSKLNVLSQRSLAEAFGLSREELSHMLLEQEKFNVLGDVSNKTLQEQLILAKERGVSIEDSLYKSLETQSAQEKFTQSVDKLKGLLTDMEPIIAKIVDFISDLSNQSILIGTTFGLIASTITGKLALGLAEAIVKMGVFTGLAEEAAAAETLGSLAFTGGAAAIGIIAGLAATAAAYKSFSSPQKVSDAKINDGSILYSGNKGSIQFDKNDDIIAGTNLFGGSSDSKIDEVISELRKISGKDNSLYLSESKLAVATSNYMGTNIQKNLTSFA